MINKFCKHPLWEVSAVLADVACGRRPADTVILDATLVNVCTRELLPHTDVAIACGRVALVGDAAHCVGDGTRLLEARGSLIAPGFLDSHIHVESSMLTVREYARSVIPHGTTGIFMDPHEICNVLGLKGVELMGAEAKTTPLKTMVTTPSCVPAVPGFEDIGSAPLDADAIAATMDWEDVVGLGEMMNFPGIVSGNPATHAIVGATLKADKIPTGHYSIPDTGAGLNAYIASGIRCCHESTRAEDALAKMRLGMYAQLREGSAWKDLHEVAKAITRGTADSRFACLISDDTHPRTLLTQGHLDHVLQRAVEEGIDPLTALQMVTLNPAQCFHLDHELGSIAPGKCADLVFLEDLVHFTVTRTLIDGEIVGENGCAVYPAAPFTYAPWALDTVHLGTPITPETFRISAGGRAAPTVRVIEVIPARVGSYERHLVLRAQEDLLWADPAQDVLKAVVFERHHATGKRGCGFVRGFGIQNGAMASTVAHDAHNLLVVGSNDADMALAANTLIAAHGGMCVVQNGVVLGLVELPVAGLMSQKPAAEVAQSVSNLESVWTQIGCTMPSPFMTMALIPLACLPELRLTDRGLVDCTCFQMADLFV